MTQDHKNIYRRLIDTWNTGDFSETHTWLAEDYVSHQRFEGIQSEGRAGFVKAVTWFRDAFPGFVFDITFMVAEGDMLVGRWSGKGRHHGAFLGIDATGREISLTGFDALRIRDGLVREVWHQEDMVGLLHQLGVPGLPVITAGGERER